MAGWSALAAAGAGVYWSFAPRGRPPAPAAASAVRAFAPAASCAACHAGIWKTYRQTGMGRAFAAFSPSRTTADFSRRNRFYHKASDRHYTMTLRDGAAFMRRHQVGPDGGETNVVEKRIDYILGSGHTGQTFVHRNPRGELIELPVAWYTAQGGYWAMNPSYDRPDHPDFRRPIKYDCFFCHNAYPALPPGRDSFYADPVYPETLPEGIDCQRCHGPGAEHVAAAASRAPAEKIRAAIVHPGRLSRNAQMEICMQCHQQSTSAPLPHAITRLERGVFSFRAGEPLRHYILHFDHPPGAGHDDKFEIAHASYRLRKSACFARSELTCTTCHDPHDVRRGVESIAQASAACGKCHAQPSPVVHHGVTECIACHMPLRRTDDAVHVVMHDHLITRRPPPGDLTAPKTERRAVYRGPVAPSYPPDPEPLYLALAQVRVGANLSAGVPALERAVREDASCGASCYFELAEAYGKTGRLADAVQAGEEAVRREPDNLVFLRALGASLSAQGNLRRGAEMLEKALAADPWHPRTLHDLGLNYARQNRVAEAIALLRRAAHSDPDSPEIHAALAGLLHTSGDAPGAEAAFREAIRARPDYAPAHVNLGMLAASAGRSAEAGYHLRQAVQHAPDNAGIRHRYGLVLAMQRRPAEAAAQFRAALELDPQNPEYHYALGAVLLEGADPRAALPHLRQALASPRPEIRDTAQKMIQALGAR